MRVASSNASEQYDDRTSELNRTDASVTAAVDPIPLTS